MDAHTDQQRHRRLRATKRGQWEKERDHLAEIGRGDLANYGSRRYRHGHHTELEDFLPGTHYEQVLRKIRSHEANPQYRRSDGSWSGSRYLNDEDYSRAVYDRAAALQLAWFSTVAACSEQAPHEWGIPADQPAPPQPLDRLTPLQPHAPDALALGERRAA
jgi:hypothetical protein